MRFKTNQALLMPAFVEYKVIQKAKLKLLYDVSRRDQSITLLSIVSSLRYSYHTFKSSNADNAL